MKVHNVSLEVVAGMVKQFPETNMIEIAFSGKSNVGKSSLLNTLINRKALARTSSQPGKTQTINFYNVEEQVYFVDLPGYGYAKVPKTERQKWGKLIENYLMNREQLKLVVLLIDIRHAPGENDKIMYNWITENGFYPLIIATKLDKIKRSQVQKHLKIIRESLGMKNQNMIIPFSSVTKQGKEEVWKIFDGLIVENQE